MLVSDEETTGKSKLRKSILSSIPREGGFRSLGTNHSKRTAQREDIRKLLMCLESLVYCIKHGVFIKHTNLEGLITIYKVFY